MLPYSYITDEELQYSGIPPRKVNGGMDTGAPASGPWGNISVVPEPIALSKNLLSASPPPNAEKQPTTFVRPGNNFVELPYHKRYDNSKNDQYALMCMN